MRAAAERSEEIARRVQFFQYRAPEELYDLRQDPDALRNLVHEPGMRRELNSLRRRMARWMSEKQDPLEPAYGKGIL
jgi:N-sulfoglucosamine sulfohydrolase